MIIWERRGGMNLSIFGAGIYHLSVVAAIIIYAAWALKNQII